MKILSVFITSNKVDLYFKINGSEMRLTYPFLHCLQTIEDLQNLILKVLSELQLDLLELQIMIVSLVPEISIFQRKASNLDDIANSSEEFSYFYFDSLVLHGENNLILNRLNYSRRMDNFISNRSVFPINAFNNDIEELAYFSDSVVNPVSCSHQRVVFDGDFFGNLNINKEYKMFLISKILKPGFYQVYLDESNSMMHYLNLKKNSSDSPKYPNLNKFFYLLTCEEPLEALIEVGQKFKLVDFKESRFYYLNSHTVLEPKLKYKSRDLGKSEVKLDPEFSCFLIDNRNRHERKSDIGVDGYRKMLSAIDKNYDYSNF